MQPVLGRGSIDEPMTFEVGLIIDNKYTCIYYLWFDTSQLSYQCVHIIYAKTNCAEGLYFSAFIDVMVWLCIIYIYICILL